MKVTCPECGANHLVSDAAILQGIERSKTLQIKAARILGRNTGGKTRLSAEDRRKRAIKAVRAREEKRQIHSA